MECAVGIANYCLTRFPCDTPPHPMLDVPWFAEKVQLCIDETTTIGLNMKKSLQAADKEIESLKGEVGRLQALNESLANRVAAQSDLLTKRAETSRLA